MKNDDDDDKSGLDNPLDTTGGFSLIVVIEPERVVFLEKKRKNSDVISSLLIAIIFCLPTFLSIGIGISPCRCSIADIGRSRSKYFGRFSIVVCF